MSMHIHISKLVQFPIFIQRFVLLTSFRLGIAAIALAGLACSSGAQTITTFDVPNSSFTTPQGINSAGQVTGYYSDASYPYTDHGFLRDKDGSVITFDPSDSIDSECFGHPWVTAYTHPAVINPAGQIAGFFRAYAGICTAERGFLRQTDGTITVFDVTLAGVSAEDQHVTAINPAGQIAGWFQYSELVTPVRGFLRQPNGAIATFDASPELHTETTPTAINPAGDVTGCFFTPTSSGGFLLRRNGSITTFKVPNSFGTCPQGINPAGQITGSYSDASYPYNCHAFLRNQNGSVTTFDAPDSTCTLPVAIDPAGQITGSSVDPSGYYHGFFRDKHGTVTIFDVPYSIHTNPTSISSSGDITGWYADAGGFVHGFVRRK